MINIEILGKFFDNHSLSIINRQLASYLNTCKDFNICITPLDKVNSDFNVNRAILKTIKSLAEKDDIVPDIFNHGNFQKFLLSGNINLKLLQICYVFLQITKEMFL